MGDEEAGAAGQQGGDGLLDEGLCLGVDGGGGLVQHEDAGVGQHCPGKGNQLLLPGGELAAALAHVAVVAVLHVGDEVVGVYQLGRRHDLLVGGVQAAVADVLLHRAGEQVGRLQHIADVGVKPQLAALPVVLAVDEHPAAGGLKEPAAEVHQGGFARAGLPHNGHGGAGGHVQVEVLQHVFRAVGVVEGHVLKGDVAKERLPVLPLGREGGAVLLHHFGAVGDFGLQLQQGGDPLDVGLGGDEVGDGAGQGLHRVGDAQGEVHKDGQLANANRAPQHHVAAAGEDKGHGQGGEEADDGHVHGVEQHRPHGGLPHAGGDFLEGGGVLVLDDQGLGGLGAGDALVVVAGDVRVDAPHLPVDFQNLFLEVQRQQGDDGHHHNHQQGQLPVDGQHHRHRADDVGGAPEDVHQAPGEHRANLVGVAHHPGHNGAHRRGVVVGEGEALQVDKELLLQIPAQVHLHLQAQAGQEDGANHLDEHHGEVEHGKAEHALAGVGGDKGVHRVAGEQGVGDVAGGAGQHHHHQRQHFAPVGPEEGDELCPGF